MPRNEFVMGENAICYGIIYNKASISALNKKLVISMHTAFVWNYESLNFNVFNQCGIMRTVVDNPIAISEIATNMY